MNNQEEIWKDIEGYEGMYSVSNLGRVKSIRPCDKGNACGKILSQGKDRKGYPIVDFCINYKRIRNKRVHRLVAQAFLENKENKPQVNHKDFNKSNNSLENLEWITGEENMEHAKKAGRFRKPTGELNPCSKLTEKQVIEILLLWGKRKLLLKEYSFESIAKVAKTTKSLVKSCIRNKQSWRHLRN